jgi:hypothetical protein
MTDAFAGASGADLMRPAVVQGTISIPFITGRQSLSALVLPSAPRRECHAHDNDTRQGLRYRVLASEAAIQSPAGARGGPMPGIHQRGGRLL